MLVLVVITYLASPTSLALLHTFKSFISGCFSLNKVNSFKLATADHDSIDSLEIEVHSSTRILAFRSLH